MIPAEYERLMGACSQALGYHRIQRIGYSVTDFDLGGWLKWAMVKRVPSPVLDRLVALYDGYIEIRGFVGVAFVISDGLVRLVVPTTVLMPGRPATTERLDQWIASGAGDVPMIRWDDLKGSV